MNERETLSAGFGTSCSIQQGEKLWCWGSLPNNNASGEYPVPMYPENNSPIFNSISTGAGFGCGIVSNGSIACFGSEAVESILTPGFGSQENIWKQISVALQHACGVQENGDAYCWGLCSVPDCGPQDEEGSLTDQGQTYVRIPSFDGVPWIHIDTTLLGRGTSYLASHTCAIKQDSSAWCWGDNTFGQLGFGSYGQSAMPKLVAGRHSWRQVCTGERYSCGVTNEGSLLCWGAKVPNTESTGTESIFGTFEIYGTVPTIVDPKQQGNLIWQSVSCGSRHACAIESGTKTAYCWGDNSFGQLGDLSTQDSTIPVPVRENPSSPYLSSTWSEISAGEMFTCGRRFGGDQVSCWGSTTNGQLGAGVQGDKAILAPESVIFPAIIPGSATPPVSTPPPNVSEIIVPIPDVAPAEESNALGEAPEIDSIPTISPPVAAPPSNASGMIASTPAGAPTAEEEVSNTPIGAIVGGVVGGLGVLAILVYCIWFFFKRKKKTQAKSQNSKEDTEISDTSEAISQAEEGHLGEKNALDEIVSSDHETGPTSVSDTFDYVAETISEPTNVCEQDIDDDVTIEEYHIEERCDVEEEVDVKEEEILEEAKGEPEMIKTSTDSFSAIIPSRIQVRDFDTVVIQKKMNLIRSRAFLSLYQMTKHFERAPRSQSTMSDSESWYRTYPVGSSEEFSLRLQDVIDTKSTESLLETWDRGSQECKAYLQEYLGRLSGLKTTRQVLDTWPEERSKTSLIESCNNLEVIIEGIRPILWDLAMKNSQFHTQRERFNICWDEDTYLKVYESVQRVLLQVMQNAFQVVRQDERYANSYYTLFLCHTFVLHAMNQTVQVFLKVI